MVPLVGVEQAYLEGLKTHEQLVAVTSVPDEKKGEELFVFHLPQAGGAERLHEIISKSNLPNIWKPKQSNYIQIASMPVLGSGKLDALKLREIAARKKGLSD